MRQDVLDYINSLSLGGFLLTSELPWEESGTPLYLKNLKKIYVGLGETTEDIAFKTLDKQNITNKLTIIRIYFACDAKQVPSNYEALVDDLLAAKDITIDGVYRSESDVTTRMEADILVTELQIRFTKLST